MGFKQSLEKQLTNFGRNHNTPTIVAMGIAAAKGVFRPTFTMMDTKESYETKRYTALREGLTEVIAIPVYYLSGKISKKVAEQLAVPKNFMSRTAYKKLKSGDNSPEVKNALEHARELAEINLPKMTTNAAFIGVCISALFVIPYVCSATIKPIMKHLCSNNPQTNNEPKKPIEIQKVQKPVNGVNTFKAVYSNRNDYGMKVGAL